jgi:aspartokinase/homoserine dehydrogenase 1
LTVQNQNPAYTRLKIHFNQLEELLQGVLTLRELTPKTRDQILSYGERCSCLNGKQNCRAAF